MLKFVFLLLFLACQSQSGVSSDLPWERWVLLKSGGNRITMHRGLPSSRSSGNNMLAWTSYKNTLMKNGWIQIEVTTNENADNKLQAYAAGYMEGYLTKQHIADRWTNYYKPGHFCSPTSSTLYCNNLRYYLTRNTQHMLKKIKKNPNSAYWNQIHLLLVQAQGLIDGYYKRTHINANIRFKPFGLYYLNLLGDMETLQPIMKGTPIKVVTSPDDVTPGSCSALVKLLPNNTDVFMGHATWTNYRSMLRMMKRYNLNFKDKSGNKIPGHTMAFPSQPGQLYSKNDFYTLSSGLVTMETSMSNFNKKLWTIVREEYWNVLEWIRNVVANRMAGDGEEWCEVFSRHNSGTYNNQWMIMDYNKFQPGVQPTKGSGLLHLLEQMPTLVTYRDITEHLVNQTYWPSYNMPYFKETNELSQLYRISNIYKSFSYHGATRAKMFARNQTCVKDIKTMFKLMRYNNYKHDPLSACNCDPPYTAAKAIAARGDLNQANGTYSMKSYGLADYVATDAKVVGFSMMKNFEILAECGPTHDQQPPFVWSKSPFSHFSHKGMPDKYDFKPTLIIWDKFSPLKILEKIHKSVNL
ncbi:putative phospholipase B-like 2 [Ciona intestinalis]